MTESFRIRFRVRLKAGVSCSQFPSSRVFETIADLATGAVPMLFREPLKRTAADGHPRGWTEAELAILREQYPAIGASACAALLPGRTLRSVTLKAHVLGLKAPASTKVPPPPRADVWTEEQVALLRQHYTAGGINACLPHFPGRTAKALKVKAQKLGLKVADPVRSRAGVQGKRPSVVVVDEVAVPPAPQPVTRPRPVAAPPGMLAPAAPATARKAAPVSWVERQQQQLHAAKGFLKSKGLSVMPNGSDPGASGWWVSGYPNALTNQQVIDLAAEKARAA